MALELTITNEQKIAVSINPKTATNKPAPIDGSPTWEKLSGAASIEVAEDGKSATLISSDDDLSDSLFQVSADADLGEGVETIMDTVLLKTIGAKAASLGLTAGEPEAKE